MPLVIVFAKIGISLCDNKIARIVCQIEKRNKSSKERVMETEIYQIAQTI